MQDLNPAGSTAPQGSIFPSTQELRALVESMPDMLYRYRFTPPAFEYVSPASSKLLGYSPHEFYADPALVSHIVHPDDRGAFQALLENPERFESPPPLRWVRQDGQIIWTEQHNTLLRDETGRIVAVQGILHDITERQRAEALVQQSAEQRRITLEAADLGAWDYRFDTGEVFWDERCRDLFGVSQGSEISYDGAIKCIHPDDRAGTNLAVSQALAGAEGGAYHREFRVVWPNGSVHWVSSHGRVYFEGEGDHRRAVRFIGVNADITEHKRADQELRRLNRTLRALGNANQALMHAADEVAFLQEACEIILQDCGHVMVWVGYAENDENRSVRPVAYAGFEEGYLETVRLTWADTERGRGPGGTAIRTGQVSICRDMLNDPRCLPWREEALRRGYASSIVFPMLAEGKAFGALMIYSREPDPFSDAEVELLTELANDLTYGVNVLRLRAAHAQAEEALGKSEERYHQLFEGMSEGFALHEILTDATGQPCDYRFLEVNPAFERLTGLKRQHIIGRCVNEILPGDDPAWMEAYGRVALSGESIHFENYSPALKRWYEVFAYRPAPRQFAVMFVDITGRKQAEELLETARAVAVSERNRLLAVMEALPVGVAIVDAQGGTVQSNHEFEKVWGGPRPPTRSVDDYAAYKAWWVDTGRPVQPEEWASAQAVQKGKTVVGQLLQIERFDGSRAFVLNSAAPILDAQGQVAGCAVALMDVTVRMQVEAEREELLRREHAARSEAEAAVRLRDQFITLASHELKTPLTSLKGYAELLLQGSPEQALGEQNARMVRTIHQQTLRLEKMVAALLDVSRIEQGQLSLEWAPVDLQALLTAILHDVEPTLRRHTLEFIPAPEPVIVNGDETRLEQVLQNLIQNAIKYSPLGGHVRVRLTQDDHLARVAVADEGIGIPAAALPQLFTRFYRAENAAASHINGLGVGLYVTREIVRLHGGEITVTSVEGKGSEFVVSLPVDRL
ncbi:MAG: PAS domain S-box protein [Anaerolineae bacterium]